MFKSKVNILHRIIPVTKIFVRFQHIEMKYGFIMFYVQLGAFKKTIAYRQNTEITPRPIMQRPPYATGGTLTIKPPIAKPIPQHIVINSPIRR